MIKTSAIFRTNSLIILFVFIYSSSFSQSKSNYILKVNITDSVRKYIEKELLTYAPGTYQISINLSTLDLDTAASKSKGTKSVTPADIKKERKLLCNCGKDANTYLEIGSMYEHLNMSDSEFINLDRSLAWIKKEKAVHPDSLNLLETEALVYSHKKDYATCIEKCEYIIKKKPDDSIASNWLPLLYVGVGDMNKLMSYTRSEIKRDPDKSYSASFFFAVGQIYQLLGDPRLKDSINKPYLKLPVDSFVDFSPVYYLEKKYPQYHTYRIMDEYLHLFSYYLLKVPTFSTSEEDPMKMISAGDTSHTQHFLDFFNSLDKEVWYKNKYAVYKALGLAHFLHHDVKDAATYFRKAIDAFPAATRSFQFNPSGDYMDDAMCAYVLGDSIAAENIIREAIRVKPGVDPDPYYELILGHNAIAKRKFKEADEHYRAALKINPQYEEAFLGLAVKSIYEKNYTVALDYCDRAYAVNKNDQNIFIVGGVANMLNNSPTTAHSMLKTVQDYDHDDDFVNNLLANYFF